MGRDRHRLDLIFGPFAPRAAGVIPAGQGEADLGQDLGRARATRDGASAKAHATVGSFANRATFLNHLPDC